MFNAFFICFVLTANISIQPFPLLLNIILLSATILFPCGLDFENQTDLKMFTLSLTFYEECESIIMQGVPEKSKLTNLTLFIEKFGFCN